MENEKPPNDIRMVIIVGLFILCIVGGGVFLALYVILPTSPVWYAVAGLVLVGIPWVVWLVAYLYSCVKIYRNARALENNAGRVFPKANMSQRSRANASSSERTQSPRLPAQDSPNGNSPHVEFGGVILLEENNNQEKEDRDSYDDDDDDGKKDESQAREKVNKRRESEIPLKSSASS